MLGFDGGQVVENVGALRVLSFDLALSRAVVMTLPVVRIALGAGYSLSGRGKSSLGKQVVLV